MFDLSKVHLLVPPPILWLVVFGYEFPLLPGAMAGVRGYPPIPSVVCEEWRFQLPPCGSVACGLGLVDYMEGSSSALSCV